MTESRRDGRYRLQHFSEESAMTRHSGVYAMPSLKFLEELLR